MKKLNLKNIQINPENVLSRSQLKNVLGGVSAADITITIDPKHCQHATSCTVNIEGHGEVAGLCGQSSVTGKCYCAAISPVSGSAVSDNCLAGGAS